jgi:NAD(P)-dependent dehydrogenase (short-subunit alcohol dehydrogenase family)
MTTHQHKIGSGFGATSTAAEVISGVDLTGRLAIVTGGYSGIGIETTRALAGAGAQVIIPARRAEVAAEALAGMDNVEIGTLDLADLASVRAFAERFLDSARGLDLVINNAGIMAVPETRIGPGWEAQFAINHLGHFALVNYLAPALRSGARVVSVSSAGHRRSAIRWDDIHFTRGYDTMQAYGQSKTANALFAVHLDALARDRGVRAFAVHPGLIETNIFRYLDRQGTIDLGFADQSGTISANKTLEQGAATQVWAGTSPQLAGLGGLYCEDCDIAEPNADGTPGGVHEYAIDPVQAARLWALSAELTGVDGFTQE